MILLIFLVIFVVTNAKQKDVKDCGPNEILFLGKCWCEPGWELDNNGKCLKPIKTIDDCECEPDDEQRKFLSNSSWWPSKGGYRCIALCRSNSQLGAPRSLPQEWKDNQAWKQLPFYMKELPKTRHTHLRSRLDEFADAFSGWTYLNNTNLGHVIEFGCGGYTQTKNIMDRVKVEISSVTLIDPLLFEYQKLVGCPYRGGKFIVNNHEYPTTLSNSSVENFNPLRDKGEHYQKYDTVIVMNVLEYSLDAFKFLETLHDVLKPNGLLIFHQRWFDNIATSSKCKTAGFYVNVLQVSKIMLDHFLSKFDQQPYFNTNQTEGQKGRSSGWCGNKDNERGFFVAVHKLPVTH